MKKLKKIAVITMFTLASTTAVAVMASTKPATTKIKTIGAQKAKQIAVSHAKLKESDVVFKKAELDYDDGVATYDIEFYYNTVKYEYDIKATNGVILEVEKDDKKINHTNSNNVSTGTNTIGVQKAKQIALTHAKLKESDVAFKKAKLDYDDGVAVYEVKFYNKGIEYTYEIGAISGKILDFDIDND